MNENINSEPAVLQPEAALVSQKQQTLPKKSEKYLKTWPIVFSVLFSGVLISASLLYANKQSLEFYAQNAATGEVKGIVQNSAGSDNQADSPAQVVKVTQRPGQPFLGEANAKVVLEVFSDFQCPFCKQFFDQALVDIRKEYIDTGKVKLVFRHFPLSFHQNAQKASQAAECANRQGKFEAYHDLLFKNAKADGSGLELAELKQYANSLGLNSGTLGLGAGKFNQCLDNNETLADVRNDTDAGLQAGVTGTPTIFINGKKIVGALPFASFKRAIETELAN